MIGPAIAYDDIWPVGCGQDDHAIELLDSVHLSQQAEQHPVASCSATVIASASGGEGINLVL